ncbi:MAG: bifunctional adenosylcobinamide kinase/adenosylcobinamide-phosphate guanylyltransferase [Anaerolineales bacterium]|uniref:bifunctional adenosylcobinamide kinase/adenosylcobinamide-phosphate guanylyltransferase n=1 Tax=Candidatus Villigracilis proximus TaxID=3140683 RepID=UPI003135DBAC|nr:bifunctional adenosylcobinamide kinase/adenosylcobinamide-phosphate guanylyltransferase [Anaerolineales bacterium]
MSKLTHIFGGEWLIVPNEIGIGIGIVPACPLGRMYRDALGRANQMLAREAQNVIFMVAASTTIK